MAKRRLSEKQLKEIRSIADRCLAILTFYKDDYDRAGSKVFDGSRQIIETAVDEGNLRGLRLALRDYEEEASGGTPAQVGELDRLLSERFGFGLKDAEAARAREVRRIVKRGAIRNADEYRLVERRADELSQADETSPEIMPINAVLLAYKGSGEEE